MPSQYAADYYIKFGYLNSEWVDVFSIKPAPPIPDWPGELISPPTTDNEARVQLRYSRLQSSLWQLMVSGTTLDWAVLVVGNAKRVGTNEFDVYCTIKFSTVIIDASVPAGDGRLRVDFGFDQMWVDLRNSTMAKLPTSIPGVLARSLRLSI
jgi:hypothetical protein